MLCKIQHSTAVVTRPTNNESGTIGYFRDEDLNTSTPATVVTKSWLNDLIDECKAVIEWGTLTPSYGSTTQIRDAIDYQINLKLNKTTADTYYVKVAGDVMTGLLTLSGNPSNALHAVPKQYADLKLPFTGGTLTGSLILHADPSVALQAATKQYVDNTSVSISGDTMTNFLTLHADPVNALHAATKQYVDNIPAPSFATLTWTDRVDVSTGTYLETWADVVTLTHTVPAGKRVMHADSGTLIHSFTDGTVASGYTTEWRVLVNGVEQDIAYTNFTNNDNAGDFLKHTFTMSVTAGAVLTFKLQAKVHSTAGKIYTNDGQWPAAGAGGQSRIKLLYF